METAKIYQMYQTYSDRELITTILAGDMIALYYLVIIKYQHELYAVICKHLIKTFNTYTDVDLEYRLFRLYNYMSTPAKITNKNRFVNIANKDNIQHWLCQCCHHFLINEEEFNIFHLHNIDFESLSLSNNSTDSPECSRTVIKKFIGIIEIFNKILTCRAKYVVFSYLYCEKKQPETLCHLDRKIALVLNTSEGNIRTTKSKAYDKVRKYLAEQKDEPENPKYETMNESFIQKYIEGTATRQEISTVRNYLMEDESNERCYDIILNIRRYTMKKLKIENDFIENAVQQQLSK
jgi:hypothetical protein